MKPDEKALLIRLAVLPHKGRPFATDIAAELGIHWKRACYILDKWSRKGWWNYGVSLRSGWMETEGIKAAAREIAARELLSNA